MKEQRYPQRVVSAYKECIHDPREDTDASPHHASSHYMFLAAFPGGALSHTPQHSPPITPRPLCKATQPIPSPTSPHPAPPRPAPSLPMSGKQSGKSLRGMGNVMI
ncbi:hypothetical protein E2C01_090049 [Portunus trituberculatus]|uniref:Uncharacterized protein n=1 Tax=Portunus trituberculatus TaxID=210409 RepID=A0A5B7JDN9_PORTR|nr:hypothetical protein [Portunus trituberculatus]